MKNKYTSYPEDNFAQHIAQVNTGKGFKCDEKYHFLVKGFFQKAFSTFILIIACGIFTLYFRLIQHVKIINKDKFKKMKKEGGVVVFNHVNFMDAVIIDAIITRFAFIRILTLEESFGVPVARFFMKYIHLVPIPSSFKAYKNFLKEIDDHLNNNGFIAVAPEGFLWPYYPGLRPFYEGAFRFSSRNNKAIIPMVVMFRKGKFLKNHVYPVVEVLDPIYPNLALTKKEQEKDLSIRTFEAMKEALIKFYPPSTPYLHFTYQQEKPKE